MVDLLWDVTGTCQQGLIDGGTILVDKKKHSFTFGTLFCGLELLGDTCKIIGSHVFSIDQMNQRKTNRSRAHSSYHRTGEALWGRICRSRPEVVVVTQSPEEKLRCEWMEHLIPKNMGIVRPDRILVVGTVEDYMTVEHKV
jgi:hypothetical protein